MFLDGLKRTLGILRSRSSLDFSNDRLFQEGVDLHRVYLACSYFESQMLGTCLGNDPAKKLSEQIEHLTVEELRQEVQAVIYDQLVYINKLLKLSKESKSPNKVFEKEYGATLSAKKSSIEHPLAGQGAWVNGTLSVGQIAALFPGCVYGPKHHREIAGYPSFGREADFLMTRFDDSIIDSRLWEAYVSGISDNGLHLEKMNIFEGLEKNHPLAFGHMINHPPQDTLPNVVPAPFDWKLDEHISDRSLIPLVNNDRSESGGTILSGIVFIASRQLRNEELFVNYRLNPNVIGGVPEWYHPIDEEEDCRRWS